VIHFTKILFFPLDVLIMTSPSRVFEEARPLRVFKEARPDFGPFGTECGNVITAASTVIDKMSNNDLMQ
jgi:hypothetical protein